MFYKNLSDIQLISNLKVLELQLSSDIRFCSSRITTSFNYFLVLSGWGFSIARELESFLVVNSFGLLFSSEGIEVL